MPQAEQRRRNPFRAASSKPSLWAQSDGREIVAHGIQTAFS